MLLSCSLLYLEHLVVPSVWDLCLLSYPVLGALPHPLSLTFQLTPAQLSTTSSHMKEGEKELGHVLQLSHSCSRQGWMTLRHVL